MKPTASCSGSTNTTARTPASILPGRAPRRSSTIRRFIRSAQRATSFAWTPKARARCCGHMKKDYGAKTPLWGYAAHPLLDGQKLICMVGGEGSTVVAFDKDTGKEIWKALSANNLGYSPPMIYEAGGKRQLIIWHGEAISGLDPETGKVYWTQPFAAYMAMAIASPRKTGEYLFLTSTFGKSMMLRLGTESPGATVAWRGDREKSFDS